MRHANEALSLRRRATLCRRTFGAFRLRSSDPEQPDARPHTQLERTGSLILNFPKFGCFCCQTLKLWIPKNSNFVFQTFDFFLQATVRTGQQSSLKRAISPGKQIADFETFPNSNDSCQFLYFLLHPQAVEKRSFGVFRLLKS